MPGRSNASELLAFIVRCLVSNPERMAIEEVEDERGRVLQLRVDPADLGRIIGKEGRTASAIRAVLAAATAGDDKTARLDILE